MRRPLILVVVGQLGAAFTDEGAFVALYLLAEGGQGEAARARVRRARAREMSS